MRPFQSESAVSSCSEPLSGCLCIARGGRESPASNTEAGTIGFSTMVVATEISEPLRLTEGEGLRDSDSDVSGRVDEYVLPVFLPGWKSDPARKRGRGADPCRIVLGG